MSKPSHPAPLDIAIVGMSACFPGARDLQAYWRNIVGKVDSVSEADPEWTGPYHEPLVPGVQTSDDRTYTIKGGFLRDLAQVDTQAFGVMPSVAAGSDPDHLIALQLAHDALADSGYLNKPFDRNRAGVILGRGTYGNKALCSSLTRGLFLDQAMDLVRALRPDFSDREVRELQIALKDQLLPFHAEHIGVLTPNVIAGLIANRLNLMGPSCIVDAACASTMIAVEQAVRELETGRCDLMITGGVHSHTPPHIFIQFCRINALSHDKIRPFQKDSDGTLLGEGVGLMVLKRRSDAERDGDRIYAVIRGIGTASDGKAKGLLAPRLEGEIMALRRAYESSGIDVNTVDLIEAHGTGTSVGDQTEIESLAAVFGGRGQSERAAGPQIGITAVKSMIGHCMPASGSAALIKTALALHHKVLPPMLCDEPDPNLELEKTPFYINNETRPWVHGKTHPRRAGVNAFGFGGINSHFILEEYIPPAAKAAVSMGALHAPESELVVLAADNLQALVAKASQLLAHLHAPLPATLDQLALAASHHAQGSHRLALVATGLPDLAKKLETAIEKLAVPNAAPFKTRNGVYYGVGNVPGKLCFLFPGEGSQYPHMLADLAIQFPVVREWFDFIEGNALERRSPSRAEVLFPVPTCLSASQQRELEDRLYEMDTAAECIFASSMGLNALFTELGFAPDALLGHSTGENTSLTVGAVNRVADRSEISRGVTELNAVFRRLEAAGQITEGALLTVGALSADVRRSLMQKLQAPGSAVQLAMDNCPNQVVLFGSSDAIATLKDELAAQGALCQTLPFGRAYHTPLFKPLADAFLEYFNSLDIGPANTTLYSACSAAPFPSDPDEIRALCCAQWMNPVRFTETIQRLYADGVRVFVEIGPSSNLTSFVTDILRGESDVLALASNSRRRPGLAQLHSTLAQLFAAGVPFTPAKLFSHRQIAALDLTAVPSQALKARASLRLLTSVVTLPDAFRKPLPANAPRLSAVVTAATTPAPTAALPPPSSLVTTAVRDPRLNMLDAHFSLMQDFLDSQARILGLSGSNQATPVQPTPPLEATRPLVLPAAQDDPRPKVRYPMLGQVSEQTATRLVSDRVFDLNEDLFIQDHAIGHMPTRQDPTLLPLTVIPFTFSMELVGEAGLCLLNRSGWVLTAIENARGSRWLSLDDGQIKLRVIAELQDGGSSDQARVSCRVFLRGESAMDLLVFEGTAVMAANYPAPTPIMEMELSNNLPPRRHKPGGIYKEGMFHGPRLQGCTGIKRWGATGMEADLVILPTHDYFARQQPAFAFDAAALDACGQLTGFWVVEHFADIRTGFPFRVRQLTLFAPPLPPGTRLTCRAAIHMQGETQLQARLDLFDASGRLVMQADGWDARVFTVPRRFHDFRMDPFAAPLSESVLADRLPAELCVRRLQPLPEGMLDEGGTIWKRIVAHMVLGRAERKHFYGLPTQGLRREEWLMGRIAAKDAVREWLERQTGQVFAMADIEIAEEPSGRPLVRIPSAPQLTPPSISITHSQLWACAVAGPETVSLGIDFQQPGHVRTEYLISGGFTDAEQQLMALHEPERTRNAIALWCAKEAASKAAGTGLEGRPQDWVVVAAQLDHRSDAPNLARVRHVGLDYDVALHAEPEHQGGGVIALCVTAAHPKPTVAITDNAALGLH